MNKSETFLGTKRITKKEFSNSKTIASAEYDTITNKLTITFRTGAVYEYFGVLQQTVKELFEAVSPGNYINQFFKKSSYKFTKIQ
jgi:hypothetical protein